MPNVRSMPPWHLGRHFRTHSRWSRSIYRRQMFPWMDAASLLGPPLLGLWADSLPPENLYGQNGVLGNMSIREVVG